MGEASCGNILDFCQNTQFIVTVLFYSPLTIINLHSTVNSRRRAEKFTAAAAAARRSAFGGGGGGVNLSASRRCGVARRGSLHVKPIIELHIQNKQKLISSHHVIIIII